MSGNEQPMNDQTWRRRLAELALACAGSLAGEEIARIRDLCGLLTAAPDLALMGGCQRLDAVRVEALIAAGAPESAVLALFGGEAGYLLSRGGSGQHLASVALPGLNDDVTASGDTLALALIGALALALSEATGVAGGAASGTAPTNHGVRAPAGLRLN